jgi:hypothetical protein
MNFFSSKMFGVVIGLALGAGAMAQSMSRDQFNAGKRVIATDYKSAMATCESGSGKAKDICQAEARGKQRVAKAELRTRYKPSENASYKLRVAQVDADNAVAKKKCEDKAGLCQ